jgi:hypothetical protein
VAPDGIRSALIVVTDKYEDSNLRKLRAPPKDAEELARVLGDESIGNFKVRTLANQPRQEIEEQLESLFSDCGRDDLLLVYFSCHGLKDAESRLYFAARNTKQTRLASTAISSDWVRDQMDICHSRRIVLILDCCYSGAFAKGMKGDTSVGLKERLEGRGGRVVLTASNSVEYSFEGEEVSGTVQPSFFTAAVVRGLESGDADRDRDNWIGIDELYDYVYQELGKVARKQTPQKWALNVEGQLYIARRKVPISGLRMAIIERTQALAMRYKELRTSMPPTRERTAELEDILASTRHAALHDLTVNREEIRLLFDEEDEGYRALALGYMEGSPSRLADIDAALDVIKMPLSDYEQYHGLRVAELLIPYLVDGDKERVLG